jgi:alpha-L-rhamnosidase
MNRRNNDFGDWLNIDAPTDKDLIATAYFAHDADLMARIARVLGKEDDARKFQALFDAVKESFNQDYVAGDGRINCETQTAYVLALGFDLLPGDKQALAAAHLARDVEHRGGLSTGFVGTGHLLPVLTRAGYTDLAYRLALSETFPSWGYSIRHGATTIWERWDGWTEEKGFQDPGMNSFNHYAFGAVGEWLYAAVGGIDLDSSEPGYKYVVMKPRLGGLAWARASYPSPYGEIASDWKIENGIFTWRVTVPVNSRATVYLPAAGDRITESGRPVTDAEDVRLISQDSGSAVFEIGSGEYRFEARLE